jgi:hypothetical protein
MLLINVANEVTPAMAYVPVQMKRPTMPHRDAQGKPIVVMVHKAY